MKQRPIRVLLIAPSLHILGGQAVQGQRLLYWLGQKEEVRMGFQPMNPKLPGVLMYLQEIKVLRTVITLVMYLAMLAARIWRYDIVHVFTASYWSYNLWPLPALFFAKLYGKKVILNYRDGQCEDHLANWPIALPTVKMWDRVVTPSGYLVEVFGRFGIKAELISNVIDMEPFHYRQRGKLRPLILHNRILDSLYNIQCTLRAFKRVLERYPEASLTLAHDGPSHELLAEYARSIGLRNYSFIGKVPYPKVPDLYDAHDIYITTPDTDCFPGSLLECYSSGLPVIATKAGGIPFIAENEKTALLVEKDDDAAVAECVFRLLEDPELAARLTGNAYEAAKGYLGPRVRDQWVELYQILSGDRSMVKVECAE